MIFAHLISKVLAPIQLPTAVKTLVLAHREELIEQAAQKCALINPRLVYIPNIIYVSKYPTLCFIYGAQHIMFAEVQSTSELVRL